MSETATTKVLLLGVKMPDHAWCCGLQMAARETGFGAVEQYMHAGKLLALELLVRVFENPHHHWSALRAEVCTRPYDCSAHCFKGKIEVVVAKAVVHC